MIPAIDVRHQWLPMPRERGARDGYSIEDEIVDWCHATPSRLCGKGRGQLPKQMNITTVQNEWAINQGTDLMMSDGLQPKECCLRITVMGCSQESTTLESPRSPRLQLRECHQLALRRPQLMMKHQATEEVKCNRA